MQLIKSSRRSDHVFSFYWTILLLFCKQRSTVSNQSTILFFKVLWKLTLRRNATSFTGTQYIAEDTMLILNMLTSSQWWCIHAIAIKPLLVEAFELYASDLQFQCQNMDISSYSCLLQCRMFSLACFPKYGEIRCGFFFVCLFLRGLVFLSFFFFYFQFTIVDIRWLLNKVNQIAQQSPNLCMYGLATIQETVLLYRNLHNFPANTQINAHVSVRMNTPGLPLWCCSKV